MNAKQFILSFLVFLLSTSVNAVIVDGINYSFNSDNGIYSASVEANLIIVDDWVTNNTYTGDIIIPETVIYEGVTYNVTAIGKEVFNMCSSLTSITIPNGIKKIGDGAFTGCVSLSSVTIPNSVITIGNDAFGVCKNLTSVTIGNSVTSIESQAFYACTNLVSLTVGNNVIYIGDSAFDGCSSLTSVTIPESVTSIGRWAFAFCSSLTDIFCYTNEAPSGFKSCFQPSIEGITLHVNDYAIESFKELNMGFKEILVFEKVTDFKLTYYVDGEEYKKVQYKYDDEITPEAEPTKKGMTFSGWSEIPEKMPGKDVDVTGTFTWSKETVGGITYQVTDTIHNYCAVIGNDKYGGDMCPLSSYKFDEEYRLTAIEKNSFKDNTQITTIMAPDSVVTIGAYAFDGCKNATKIEIDKYIEKIGERAFANIDKLTDVFIFAESVPVTDRTAFENSYTEDYVTLHVPAGSIEKYKAAAPWKNFKEIVAITAESTDYTLTYMVDGEVYETYRLPAGMEPVVPVTPTKQGYIFSGWSEIPEIMPAEDVIVEGTFTKDSDGDDTTEDVITLKDSGKGTWCSENDLDFTDLEDIKAYIASGYDDIKKTIWLTRVYSVPAGTGIMVKGTPGEHKIPYAKVRAYYANMFKGVVGDAVKIEATDGDWTNYYMAGGQFKIVNGSTTINPNRCYLQLPTLVFAGTRSVDVVYEDEIDDKTGINPSFITNNQEPAVIYNLQGQRIDNPKKGLYIKNGKKVIVR